MTRYVALLRGINVGKNNRLPMADLRAALESIGGTGVGTYLQSGNAVLDHPDSTDKVAAALRKAVHEGSGIDVPILVRTADWLEKALRDDPFGTKATNPKTYLLAFLSETPSAAAKKKLADAVAARQAKGGKDSGDEYELDRDRGYLWCPVNVHESLFASLDWDKLLGVQVTMRNWDTANRLLALARG
ncbi:DUF1697 domain-containing protein [Nakamurella alba]|uniref:DUF1697 domain-containing protein n=1 Tax=Nakamurella alba TaxID=2665158 RepID=UPI0018AA63DF|nr:DUF1697 domain-containing protein [Nakamurella alba]